MTNLTFMKICKSTIIMYYSYIYNKHKLFFSKYLYVKYYMYKVTHVLHTSVKIGNANVIQGLSLKTPISYIKDIKPMLCILVYLYQQNIIQWSNWLPFLKWQFQCENLQYVIFQDEWCQQLLKSIISRMFHVTCTHCLWPLTFCSMTLKQTDLHCRQVQSNIFCWSVY